MTGERVAIQYDIQGAEQGATEIARLKTSVDSLDQSLQQSGTAIRTFEQATQEAAATAQAAASGTDGFGTSARQVAAHVQGLTGLVANLSGQLGSSSLGQGAHLFSALAGVTSQSLALGSVLGPGGAVVGAVTGLVPLFAELVGANEQVTHATDTMTQAQHNFTLQAHDSLTAIDQLIRSQRQLADETNRRDRISQGLGSVDEQFAAAELAGRRVGELTVERSRVLDQIRQIQTTDFRNADQLVGLEARRLELTQQIQASHEEATRLGQLAGQAQEEERQIATDILEIDQRDAAAAGARAQHNRAAAGARRQEHDAAHDLEQLALHGSFTAPDDTINGVLHSITVDADRRQAEIDQNRARAVTALHERQLREQQEAAQKVEHAQQTADQARERKQQLFHQERMRQEQEYANALQSTGQTFGQVFGTAFEKALQGQESFGDALEEGAKQALLQTGTQMVAEGTGAIFTGIGLSVLNPPAAATKEIEGIGKLALGVSLGAAGAAIPSPSAAGKAAEPPSSARSSSSDTTAPPPVVINLNAPTVIGQTQADFGRGAARSILEAQRRYGRTTT